MLSLLVGAALAAAPLVHPVLAKLDEVEGPLEALYQDLHRSPELSLQEEKTAGKMAERLRALGFEVTTGVGGHGVVGVLRNGKGPTVLLRTDMDALPVREETGLPWASTTQLLPAGQVVVRDGPILAAANGIEIVVHGRGGHGAAPHLAVDPVLIASRIVVALQGIVARENDPLDPAVITVGTIHGGTKSNVIPDDVTLQLTVRSYGDKVQARLLEAIERVAQHEYAFVEAEST